MGAEIEVSINCENDILKARYEIRHFIMDNFEFSPLHRMHALTAVSELTRNIYKYAEVGKMKASIEDSMKGKKGLKLIFEDNGPGILDIEEAMKPKPINEYQKGMGLGLSGSKKLADEFYIDSRENGGTRITWILWER